MDRWDRIFEKFRQRQPTPATPNVLAVAHVTPLGRPFPFSLGPLLLKKLMRLALKILVSPSIGNQIVLESAFLHMNLRHPRYHSPPALLDGLKSIANAEKEKPFKPTAEMKSLASNTVSAILQLLDKRMISLTFAILDTRIEDAEGEDKARLVCLREDTLSAFARHGIFGGKGYPVDHISKNFPKLSSLDDLIKNSKVSIGDILNESDVTQDAARVEELATNRKYKSKLERELVYQLMQLELSRMGKISQELKASNEDAPGKSKRAKKKVPEIELNEETIDYLKLDEDYETTGNMPPGRPCGGIVYSPVDIISSRVFQRDILPAAVKWIVRENNHHYKKHRVKSDNPRQQLIETKVMTHKLMQKQAAPLYVGPLCHKPCFDNTYLNAHLKTCSLCSTLQSRVKRSVEDSYNDGHEVMHLRHVKDFFISTSCPDINMAIDAIIPMLQILQFNF